jgi:hypothetical protein
MRTTDFFLQVIQRFLPVPNTASADSQFHKSNGTFLKNRLYSGNYPAYDLQIRDQSLRLSAEKASTAYYVELKEIFIQEINF